MLRDKVADMARDSEEFNRQRASGPSISAIDALERDNKMARSDADNYRSQMENLRA